MEFMDSEHWKRKKKYRKDITDDMIEYAIKNSNQLKDKFESMNCFQKYKSYTNSKNLPKFVRELKSIV